MTQMPNPAWLSEEAQTALAELGADDFGEAVGELKVVLSDADFRQEVDALVLVAVRDPDAVEDGVDALVTVITIFCPAASQALDLGGIITLLVLGQTVKRALRALRN